MQICGAADVKKVLGGRLLKADGWGGLIPADPAVWRSAAASSPDLNALEIYSLAHRLAMHLGGEERVSILIGNSTFPTEDEQEIFQSVAALSWAEILDPRSLYWSRSRDRLADLVLLIYFAVVFEWHLFLVGSSDDGCFVAIQDGTVYGYCHESSSCSILSLFEDLASNPLRIEGAREPGSPGS